MLNYIIRRLLLMVLTIFGIMVFSFLIVQLAPGGPIDRIAAKLSGLNGGNGSEIGSIPQPGTGTTINTRYPGLDEKLIKALEKEFGFDKPPLERFGLMVKHYLTFDFGESYFRKVRVIDLIREKLPVSISLGLWLTLISYAISIPLGIRKAVTDGSKFDVWTSGVIVVGYAIPNFLLGVFLIIFLASGNYVQWFPLQGLVSENWDKLSLFDKIVDYFWHLVLPLTALGVSAFASLTFLTKNTFIDEIRKQYVMTARAKGLNERQVLYGHVFRNAMLLVIANFPSAFVRSMLAGSLLIERVFSLDGLGLLSWDSLDKRDYAVVFATLYIYGLIGIGLNLISDLIYTLVDPRIDFETREV